MDEKNTVLDAMRKAGEPLNAGKIAELTGLDRKVVDKAMAALKIKKAKEIIEKAGVEYANLIPDSVLLEGRLNGIQAFPESFFVDREGNVVSEPYVGAMTKNHWRVTMKNEIEKTTQRENGE